MTRKHDFPKNNILWHKYKSWPFSFKLHKSPAKQWCKILCNISCMILHSQKIQKNFVTLVAWCCIDKRWSILGNISCLMLQSQPMQHVVQQFHYLPCPFLSFYQPISFSFRNAPCILASFVWSFNPLLSVFFSSPTNPALYFNATTI